MQSRSSRLTIKARALVTSLSGIALGMAFWFGSGLQGNDTGGIIAWSPGIEDVALDMAAGHCMSYGKYAVITSVHPWSGDYIGFVCRRAGRWGPLERIGLTDRQARTTPPIAK